MHAFNHLDKCACGQTCSHVAHIPKYTHTHTHTFPRDMFSPASNLLSESHMHQHKLSRCHRQESQDNFDILLRTWGSPCVHVEAKVWLQTRVLLSLPNTQMFSFPCGKHSKTCTVYNHPMIICVWFLFVFRGVAGKTGWNSAKNRTWNINVSLKHTCGWIACVFTHARPGFSKCILILQ